MRNIIISAVIAFSFVQFTVLCVTVRDQNFETEYIISSPYYNDFRFGDTSSYLTNLNSRPLDAEFHTDYIPYIKNQLTNYDLYAQPSKPFTNQPTYKHPSLRKSGRLLSNLWYSGSIYKNGFHFR